MEVRQVYELLNTVTEEILGDSVVVNEDLSNVVDIGRAFINANELDNYVRKLTDHVGKMVFVDRIYTGRAPSVLMDGWEYGSILEKVRAELPVATENESWELEDGMSYDPNIFYKPSVSVKFYNDRVTFEIPLSITEKQVKSAFTNSTQMNAFVSMIRTAVENSMTIKLDALVMRTINAGIAETMHSEFPGGTYTGATGAKAVNLLYEYNQANGTNLSVRDVFSKENVESFMRFATLKVKNTVDRMHNMSTIFNVGKTQKFTPAEDMHIVLLSEFKNAADVYLENGVGQFRTENIQLPDADVVSYWQGSGLNYDFNDTSAINVISPSGDTVNATGIVAVIFDRDALGVANVDRRVTVDYNAKAEFWNEWHKYDAGYFLDLDENFVVFYIA